MPRTQNLGELTRQGEVDYEGTDDDPADRFWAVSDQNLPDLPRKLSPSQAARLAEVFDFLHRGLASAAEGLRTEDESPDARVPFADWQKVQAVQMLLARYLRAVADPDSLDD